MRLVLAVDAIVAPITGIGRYASELARHHHTDDFESLKYYFAGHWLSDPFSMLRDDGAKLLNKSRRSRYSIFRLTDRMKARATWASHICHSPNYFLPQDAEGGVVTVHDLSVFKYPETHPKERIEHFERSFNSTLRRACHIITDSHAIRTEVIEYFGWQPDKISTVHLGVSEQYRPRSAEEVSVALKTFGLEFNGYALCVSTLEPRKRVLDLLVAYESLPQNIRSRFPLVLTGSKGWLNDDIHLRIERGERQGWLRNIGFVDEKFLPLLYSGARMFAFPSSYEGFGLPLLEALASGIPTVTTNTSSLPEVADGAAALVEVGDHDALADAIQCALIDEQWRETKRTRGLEVAAAHSWRRCASETLAVCRNAYENR
jgi:alpha-1,3-rhamnosyl/mannosyltransferase